MKLKLLLLFIGTALLSCSSIKKTQEAINYGNFDNAIAISLKNLRENKFKKGNQPYIIMLEEAYAKANERDLRRLDFLKQEGNPSNLEEIYNTYKNLNNRQESIRPLLPLTIAESNRKANFKFSNYSTKLITAKNQYSEHLYTNAISILNSSENKYDFRAVYDDLIYLQSINPNYKETNSLINEAHTLGTNFVIVSMLNNSNKIIPIKLEADLLNFNTYNLNDLWTVYHSKKQSNLTYDYSLKIFLQEINISPEFVKEKEVIRENNIVDGWEYLKNKQGEIQKDSLGNKIKVDVYKRVKCKLNMVTQTKSTQVVGQINYLNLANQQTTQSFPLASEFIFENIFANTRGDKRALNKDELYLTRNQFVPFPSNEQMVYDSGENLKEKIRQIIIRHKI